MKSGWLSTRSNSLSTSGCGEIKQTCNAFFFAVFFTELEISGTENEEQGPARMELRSRAMVTEWRRCSAKWAKFGQIKLVIWPPTPAPEDRFLIEQWSSRNPRQIAANEVVLMKSGFLCPQTKIYADILE